VNYEELITTLEAEKRKVRCVRCQANPGEPCTRPDGAQMKVAHSARDPYPVKRIGLCLAE
jgi:hypothetical protein